MTYFYRDFQVGFTWWRYDVKNQSIYHAESHFDTSWKVPLHSSCRKREGAIATCSDTLTTAGFHQSYSKSITESQQFGTLSNLIADIVIGRLITFVLYFKGRKQIRKAETFVSSVSIHFFACFLLHKRSGSMLETGSGICFGLAIACLCQLVLLISQRRVLRVFDG